MLLIMIIVIVIRKIIIPGKRGSQSPNSSKKKDLSYTGTMHAFSRQDIKV